MRDLTQARMEFFIAIGLLILTGVIGYFLTYPQFKQFQFFQSTQPQNLALEMPDLSHIPHIPNHTAAGFTQGVVKPIDQIAESNHVQLLQANSNLKNPKTVSNLPSNLVDIPLLVKVKGAYPNVEHFIGAFIKHFPQCDIQSIQLSAEPDTPKSVLVTAQIHLNMLINNNP